MKWFRGLDFFALSIVSTPAYAGGGFDLAMARGDETLRYQSPSGATELCFVPKHLPGFEYRGKEGSKDREAERELCALDLYKEGPTKLNGGVAACPKVTSTSAAIEFQELETEGTKKQLESVEMCGYTRPTDTLTKFKTTDNDRACAYGAGAMLSYHLSRALGDVLHVPTMVLRTVDIETMQKVSVQALRTRTNGTIRKSYQNYIDAYRNPAMWPAASTLYTNDFKQVYGFLRGKVKGDVTHPGWTDNNEGVGFESLESVRDVFAPAPARRLFGKTLSQAALQRMIAARDVGDLIVLDQLTSQADRYTGLNLGALSYYYFVEEGKKLSSLEKRKVDKGEKPKPANAMLIRRMVAKDNDCTFINGNRNARYAYVERLRHLHPRTYAGVQRLASLWNRDKTLQEFLSTELNMTARYIAVFQKNLQSVSQTLLQNCRAGRLRLDLDSQNHFFGVDAEPGCEVQ